MKETQRIRITIAGKTYALKVDASQEEVLRLAAKKVDETINRLKQNFSGGINSDDQDYLAMATLSIATELMENRKNNETERLMESLESLDKQLTEYIQSSSR